MTNRAACFDVPTHHKDLFAEYAETTAEPKRVGAEGDAKVSGFSDGFMGEAYHRLYADSPNEIENPAASASARLSLHKCMSELPEFESLRKQTNRDPLWSGMATCSISDSIANALPARTVPPDAERADQILQGMQAIQDLANDGGHTSPDLENQIAEMEGEVRGETFATAEQADQIDGSVIRQALRAGIAQASQDISDAKDACSALGWGDQTGMGGGKRDPGVSLALARKVKNSDRLRRIVELAGRMIMTSRAKRATRSEYARSEIVGVEQTGEIANLLPVEMMALTHPLLKLDLFRKLVERNALGYRMRGKQPEAKGPIVIMIDQSGSMSGDPDCWSKAIALALLDSARTQNRAFGIVLYDSAVGMSRLFPDPKKADPIAILDLLSSFSGGGTSFAEPMDHALNWIAASGTFKRADIVHITDGSADCSRAKAAMTRADLLGAHVYGIQIGASYGSSALREWSHEVTTINDVRADGPAIDLVFDHV